MNTTKKNKDPNREWVLDPKNLDEILDRVLNHGDIIFCPATKDEMKETSKLIAEHRAARATSCVFTKQLAYA